jgi:hypothetical protein
MSTLLQHAGGIAPVRICRDTSDFAIQLTVTVRPNAGTVTALDHEQYRLYLTIMPEQLPQKSGYTLGDYSLNFL